MKGIGNDEKEETEGCQGWQGRLTMLGIMGKMKNLGNGEGRIFSCITGMRLFFESYGSLTLWYF